MSHLFRGCIYIFASVDAHTDFQFCCMVLSVLSKFKSGDDHTDSFPKIVSWFCGRCHIISLLSKKKSRVTEHFKLQIRLLNFNLYFIVSRRSTSWNDTQGLGNIKHQVYDFFLYHKQMISMDSISSMVLLIN